MVRAGGLNKRDGDIITAFRYLKICPVKEMRLILLNESQTQTTGRKFPGDRHWTTMRDKYKF